MHDHFRLERVRIGAHDLVGQEARPLGYGRAALAERIMGMRGHPERAVCIDGDVVRLAYREFTVHRAACAIDAHGLVAEVHVDEQLLVGRVDGDAVRHELIRPWHLAEARIGLPFPYPARRFAIEESCADRFERLALVPHVRHEESAVLKCRDVVDEGVAWGQGTAAPDELPGIIVVDEFEELDGFAQAVIHDQQLVSPIGTRDQVDAVRAERRDVGRRAGRITPAVAFGRPIDPDRGAVTARERQRGQCAGRVHHEFAHFADQEQRAVRREHEVLGILIAAVRRDAVHRLAAE